MGPSVARTRQPNGRATIYFGADGRWHGRVSVGVRHDGRPDRRHVSALTKAEVAAKVRQLEKRYAEATLTAAGERWTVEAWLVHWLEEIVGPNLRANTLAGYRVAVHHHLIPGIGKHRLTALRPEHLERLYADILATSTKSGARTRPATAHQVHRTVRAALNEAVRRGHLAKNPAFVARAPRVEQDEVEPFTVEEIQRIFKAASRVRNGARWEVALALGLRQGEALGLQWRDIDLTTQTMAIRRNRLRPKYRHGCDGTCGRKYPGYCPERVPIRPDTDSTKSRAGRRYVGLPTPLVQVLRAHRATQNQERLRAGSMWTEGDWVFATETGQPINPRTDWARWKELLVAAELRDSRLHDARHTAATVLLLLGVNETTMMGVMGWSNPAMTQRYAHVVASVRQDVATRIGGLLWQDEGAQPRTN